jgi:hypothetical protein
MATYYTADVTALTSSGAHPIPWKTVAMPIKIWEKYNGRKILVKEHVGMRYPLSNGKFGKHDGVWIVTDSCNNSEPRPSSAGCRDFDFYIGLNGYDGVTYFPNGHLGNMPITFAWA